MPRITKERITKGILYKLIDLMLSASAHSGGVGVRTAGEVWLNPQPIPPDDVERPHPEPWCSAVVARQVISMTALSLAAEADEERGLRIARSILGAFIDDFCSVSSSRFPLPPPWPRSGAKPKAVDLLVAAAQFEAVANALKGQPIAKSLAEGADRLLEVGLRRFEG